MCCQILVHAHNSNSLCFVWYLLLLSIQEGVGRLEVAKCQMEHAEGMMPSEHLSLHVLMHSASCELVGVWFMAEWYWILPAP